MNSCLQCLLSIPEINFYFSNSRYEYNNITKISQIACEAFKEIIFHYKKSNKSLKAPSSIFRICHSFLAPNEQHDCQEFLRRFLSKIQEELNLNKKYSFPEKTNYKKIWEIYKENNPSIIDNLFCGLMRSSVICNKCKGKSETYDPFLDLSVPIRRKKNETTLENCFESYFNDELIDCEYKCEYCKKKTSVISNLYLDYKKTSNCNSA
jgi:ubiquitin C-terminal hydrolase